MKTLPFLFLFLVASIHITDSAHAQCPNPVDEAHEHLLHFINNSHYQQARADLGLANVSESEINILNGSHHAEVCQELSQFHPFNQTRDVNEYPGPDKITYYKIRDLYLIVEYNFRYHEADDDEIWIDLVPSAIIVYDSDYERVHQNWVK